LVAVRFRPLAGCSRLQRLVGMGVLTSLVRRRLASQELNHVDAEVPPPRRADVEVRPTAPPRRSPVTALALMIRPTRTGWAVCLSDGQELVHYRGPFSKRLAMRYLRRYMRAI
jgi:hypothetical protein